MKRFCSIFLLTLLICCVMISPAMAVGESMTDPVEIIDTTEPTEPPEPTESPEPSEAPVPSEPPEETEEGKGPSDSDSQGINDPDVPMAAYNGESGGAWALVNLICTALTVGFGADATRQAVKMKNRKEEFKLEDKNYIVLRKEKKQTENGVEKTVTEFVQKSPLWKSGLYDLVSSAGAVAAFVLTENMSLPMCLTDRYTPLMAGILAVCLGVYGVTAGGKKLDQKLAEKALGAGTSAGV